MNLQQMSSFIRRYRQEQSMTDNIFRYCAKVSSVTESAGVFGMNFEEIFSTPDSQKAAVFLAQEKRAQLLRAILNGQTIPNDEMEAAFGFSFDELEALRAEEYPVKKSIPEKLCILCFDDAYKSQYNVAAPLLQKLGFRATFFIAEMQPAHGPSFEDKAVFMTWDEIKELQHLGFELGNHSLHHVFGSQNMGRDFNIAQITGLEQEFAAHGLEPPVSYAYPSGISTPEVVSVAHECGYRWGRGNQEKGTGGIRGMTYYDPLTDSPLAMCNFGDPDFYTEELLRRRIAETPASCIFGLTYHDVTPGHWLGPCPFERQMEILAEEGMTVIAVRDLEEYIDPVKAFEYTK